MRTAIFFCITLSFIAPAFAQDDDSIDPDVVYGHKDGLALTMDVYHPEAEPNKAAILFMMSGGWVSRWAPPDLTQPLFEPYLKEGFTVIAVRHGSSPRYTIPEAVSDVKNAVRFVRKHAAEFGIDPQRIGAMGMSAGGHLALMLGTTGDNPDDESSRVAAVVALVPPTDLRVVSWKNPDSKPVYRNFPALDISLDEAEKQSPLVHVTADDAPALMIMGGKDELVPAEHGEWIAEAFKKQKVIHKLIVFPDAGHGLEGQENRERTVLEATNWFKDHLTK